MTTTIQPPVEVDVEPTTAIQVDGEASMEELPPAMQKAFGQLGDVLHRHGIRPAGPPRAIYTHSDPERMRFTLAIPVEAAPELPDDGPVRAGELPAARTLRFTHTGPYDGLVATYGRITGWMIDNGRMESEADWSRYMPSWEEYVDDPETIPPDQLRTFIHLPVDG